MSSKFPSYKREPFLRRLWGRPALRFDYTVALAGNPNTGKSTVFNALTGLNQHTGNWPGKTVQHAVGWYTDQGLRFCLIDLPGTYSLTANSEEEQIARDYLCFSSPDVTVVVVDATRLKRNLYLVLQLLEITSKVVVAMNLVDEAEKKRISVNPKMLAEELGVPVVATAARNGEGLKSLVGAITGVVTGRLLTTPRLVPYGKAIEEAVSRIEPGIQKMVGRRINTRWLALRLLAGDQTIKTFLAYHVALQGERKISAEAEASFFAGFKARGQYRIDVNVP